MKSKSAKPASEPMTIGTRMVAKYRPLASKMTKAQREQALARALQLIYGDAEPVRLADRK